LLGLLGSVLVSIGLPWSPWVSPWSLLFLPGLLGSSLVSRDLCWSSVVSLSLQGSLMVFLGLHGSLLGLHCSCLVSRDLPLSPGVSAGLLVFRGLCWSLGLQWSLLISPAGLLVFKGSVLVSLGLQRSLLISPDLHWSPEVGAALGAWLSPAPFRPAGLAVSESCPVVDMGPVKSAMVCSGVHIRHIIEGHHLMLLVPK